MQETTKMMRMIAVSKEDNWYVATDIQTQVASQGKTAEEAISNVKEALELYFEENGVDDIGSELPMVTTIEVSI